MKFRNKILILCFAWLLCFQTAACTQYSASNTTTQSNQSTETELEPAVYLRTVDGDTIEITFPDNTEPTKVRLIGVNTLESVSPDTTKNNKYGEMASDFTKSQFKDGQEIWLEYDEEKYDKYGRLLAYVWTSDNINTQSETDITTYMYNAIILTSGQGYDIVYEPNHKYANIFANLCKTAQKNKTGLWQQDEFWNLVEQTK